MAQLGDTKRAAGRHTHLDRPGSQRHRRLAVSGVSSVVCGVHNVCHPVECPAAPPRTRAAATASATVQELLQCRGAALGSLRHGDAYCDGVVPHR
jgi:hypothetical protein